MKVILQNTEGKLDIFERPMPSADPDGVVIKIHAAALNRADLLQRAGQYPPPDGWPEWFGLEAAGEIVEIGEEAAKEGKWKLGDKVCALLGGGGYAEYVKVPAGMVMPIPAGLDMIEASALPEAYGAAYLFLFVEGGLKKGDTVLVQAGASGLASVLIPLARSFGARVLTTVLTDEIAQRISHLKADRVIVTGRESLAEVMREEKAAGHGVDITIDCLGGETVAECIGQMNRGGRWIMIATLAGDVAPINMKTLYVTGTRLIGTTLRSRTPEAKAEILNNLVRDVWPKVESGEVRPTIHKVYPFEEADAAQDEMASGRSVGKIVLKVL